MINYIKYILIVFWLSIYSQDIPPIQSFQSDDYDADIQNWMITQSDDGSIVVANSSGILTYNGSWKFYESPNNTVIRSVKYLDGNIYSGKNTDFGFWSKNSKGEYSYTSIPEKFDFELIEDEEFWDIKKLRNWIVFQSLSRLIFVDPSSQNIKVIEPGGAITKSFEIDKSLFFHMPDQGIFTVKDGSVTPFLTNKIFRDNVVINMFKIDDEYIILTENKGFYKIKNGNLSKWSTDLDLNKLTIYSAILSSDNSILIGTIGSGFIKLSSSGNVLEKLNKSNGLINNTILSIFEDKNFNIWLALDNGISVINDKSPFRIFNDLDGKLGAVYAYKKFKDFSYVGTNQGLFFKNNYSNDDFQLVDGTSGQVWSLVELDGELFCGHNQGTFIIKNSIAKKIPGTNGSWTFKKSNTNNLIFEGHYKGINVLEKKNGNWTLRNSLQGYDISARFFEVSDNNQIYVVHGYKGVYRLTLSPYLQGLKNVQFLDDVSIEGNPSIAKFNNRIYYHNQKGIYSIDNSGNFLRDSNLSKAANASGLMISESEKLWIFSNDNIFYAYNDDVTNKLKMNSVNIPKKLREAIFDNISSSSDNDFVIGTRNGYISMNLNDYKIENENFSIDRIEVSSFISEPVSIDIVDNFLLDYNINNISFFYNTADYQLFNKNEYSFKLEGLLEDWSLWSEENSNSFKNLEYGTYTFKVKSRTAGSINPVEKQIKFTIDKPWYLSNFMFINYSLLFGLIIFITNRYTRNYYLKKELRLAQINKRKLEIKEFEKKQELINLENEKLQQDIESKSRELAISTMSMIKKNQFLSKIKDDLKKTSELQKIKNVIKTIDRNLNNEDDWKFFEEAFNNADKEFLKKIKTAHPNLTNNDLKLCAYLRLNLSSKDIAPLLNISLRSVEIKRYRLRKKMELSHNEGLTDYILSL
jgi:DNA-binding CsgD family transcriptional regulator